MPGRLSGRRLSRTVRVPRDAYVWRVAKPGFATAYIHRRSLPARSDLVAHSSFDLTWKLRPEKSVPPEMVVVAGARVGLAFPLTASPRESQIDDFLIDRHEVTNEEYKKFVDAGGYQKREFWKQPFVKDGRTVPWEEAVALFHDADRTARSRDVGSGRLSKGAREVSGRRSQLVRGSGVRGVRGQEPSHRVPLDACVAIDAAGASLHR